MQADPAVVRAWLTFLVGVHDLGKATPGFQGQVPEQRRRLQDAGWVLPAGAARAHDVLGLMILHGLLRQNHEQLAPTMALDLATVVAAHHGTPASPSPAASAERHLGNATWDEARAELFTFLLKLSGLSGETMPDGLAHASRPLLSLLGGMVRVCDWFACSRPATDRKGEADGAGSDRDEYVRQARERGEESVRAADWGKEPPASADFETLFGLEPNAMQQRITALAGPLKSSAMVLIEAPTGTGKTEAALMLTHLWEANGLQAGAYIALPTQATASAMWGRLGAYPAFAGGRLCHGRATENTSANPPLAGEAAKLLDRLGVGTVDQALRAILSDRQAWVRLLGLANKIVVLDEVHAHDAYTCGLLERLLEWLAALNCSVIVLSATLPAAQRSSLLKAYGAIDAPVRVPYPRVTLATPTFQEVAPLPGAHGGAQSEPEHVRLRHLTADGELSDGLLERLGGGGCAAIICNTVGAAQAMYRRLKPRLLADDVEIGLLHARYPQAWREEREAAVIRQFGKQGQRPERAVLVATQVIEQSLDLDFDLLISEWAPVDALLQRRGRLHRHQRPRPEGLHDAELWLLPGAPGGAQDTDRQGLPDFGPSAAVYDEYLLLRTWLELHGREGLTLPTETEALVEACYAPAPPEVAEPLRSRLRAARQRLTARLEAQKYGALQVACAAGGGHPSPAGPGQTRQHDLPALEVVCLQRGAGAERRSRRAPRTDGDCFLPGTRLRVGEPVAGPLIPALRGQAIALRGHELVRDLRRLPRPASWREHPALRALTPLYLDEHLAAHLGQTRVRLDRELGLVMEP